MYCYMAGYIYTVLSSAAVRRFGHNKIIVLCTQYTLMITRGSGTHDIILYAPLSYLVMMVG